MSFLLVTFLWTSKDKFIGNEFVLRSRPDKFDRIKFEQPTKFDRIKFERPKVGLQGELQDVIRNAGP